MIDVSTGPTRRGARLCFRGDDVLLPACRFPDAVGEEVTMLWLCGGLLVSTTTEGTIGGGAGDSPSLSPCSLVGLIIADGGTELLVDVVAAPAIPPCPSTKAAVASPAVSSCPSTKAAIARERRRVVEPRVKVTPGPSPWLAAGPATASPATATPTTAGPALATGSSAFERADASACVSPVTAAGPALAK